MRKVIAILAVILAIISAGCEKISLFEGGSAEKGITVMPAKVVYPIGSVFVGGGIADPSKGSSHRCHFYSENFEEGPSWDDTKAMVYIAGFRHTGVEYTKPGQYVNYILINGLDESLGLGEHVEIPLNQGEYEGGNDLIKDVQFKSYKFSSYKNDNSTLNSDCDIHIVIKSKAGDTITIRFANGKTPYDGYY